MVQHNVHIPIARRLLAVLVAVALIALAVLAGPVPAGAAPGSPGGSATSSATATASVGPAEEPGAPTDVTVVGGDREALVSFTPPADDGGSPILGYGVLTFPSAFQQRCASSPCEIGGLTNGLTYQFYVLAANENGFSQLSAPSVKVTAGAPTAPDLLLVASRAGALDVSFTKEASDNGSAVTKYQVSTDGGDSWSDFAVAGTETKTGEVAGLLNGRTYDVRVRAVNARGAGASSNLRSNTPATVPGAPRNVAVSGALTTATVSWTAPSSNGGSAIVEYTVTSTPGGKICSTETTSCSISNLDAGVEYTFSVVADNTTGAKSGTGTGPAGLSESIELTTVPDAPSGLSADPGDRTLALSWDAPASNGFSPITRYEVSVDNGISWKRVPVSPLRVTVAPVLNGSSYTARVRAVNANGAGAATAAVRVTIPDWFSDPVGPGAQARQIDVPSNPKSYRGPRRLTKAQARSRFNTIAYPDNRLDGRQLQPVQAVDLAGAVVFELDTGELTTEGKARVRSMISSLRYATAVTCEGYADYAGSTKSAVALSEQRAENVCDAIDRYARSVTSLNVRAYGGTRPVVVGGPASQRTANSRVVVVVRQ